MVWYALLSHRFSSSFIEAKIKHIFIFLLKLTAVHIRNKLMACSVLKSFVAANTPGFVCRTSWKVLGADASETRREGYLIKVWILPKLDGANIDNFI